MVALEPLRDTVVFPAVEEDTGLSNKRLDRDGPHIVACVQFGLNTCVQATAGHIPGSADTGGRDIVERQSAAVVVFAFDTAAEFAAHKARTSALVAHN